MPVPAGQHAEHHHQAEERLPDDAVNRRQDRRDLGHPRARRARPGRSRRRARARPAPSSIAAARTARNQPASTSVAMPDGRAVEPMQVLDPDAERGIPEVVQEHVDAERRRPVGHGQPDAIGRHRAPHIQQRQGERRREERDPVRSAAVRCGRLLREVFCERQDSFFLQRRTPPAQSLRPVARRAIKPSPDRAGRRSPAGAGSGAGNLPRRPARCIRTEHGRPTGCARSCSAPAATSSPTRACWRARDWSDALGPATRL